MASRETKEVSLGIWTLNYAVLKIYFVKEVFNQISYCTNSNWGFDHTGSFSCL